MNILHPDLAKAPENVEHILGCILGTGVGDSLGLPLSVAYLRRLSLANDSSIAARPIVAGLALPLRNVVFLIIIIWHGVRRLFPPY